MKEQVSDINKKNKARVVELVRRKKSTIYNLILVMGGWRKFIVPSIRNILISKALNHCVRKDGLVINGYWITDRKIFLIIKCKKYSIDYTLEKFVKRLNREVRSYLKYRVCTCVTKKKKRFFKKKHRLKIHFKECRLTDENLIKLLTGRKIKLGYYSPGVAKLEDLIEHYNYCSAQDYAGAEGPVIVKLLKKKHNKCRD